MLTQAQQNALDEVWRQLKNASDFLSNGGITPSFPIDGEQIPSRAAGIAIDEAKEQTVVVGTDSYIRRLSENGKWGLWESVPPLPHK